MDARYAAVVILMLGACRSRAPAAATPATAAADSLVLERSICFGFCPAYRLSVARSGMVRFEPRASRAPSDSGRVASGTVPPAVLDSLVARAAREHFFALPDTIMADSALCGIAATDFPTATITIFEEARTKQVIHYHGCFGGSAPDAKERLARLTALEIAVDSAARADRWIGQAR